MPRYGISIEKTVLFRGVQQPFANVYHYEAPDLPVTDTTNITAAVDQLVAIEKTMHASTVTFTRGRCWNTGSGTQAGNQMRVDKNLSGVGAGSPIVEMDRERALLLRWPAGINTRGKPVYLRKWYHLCGVFSTLSFSAGMHGNTLPLGAANQAVMEGKGDELATLEVAATGPMELCAQTGRQRTGDAECHPYLEHHQLGDQWR